MWPSRLSLIKVLFFVNRYMPFLDMSLATVGKYHSDNAWYIIFTLPPIEVALGAKNPRVCAERRVEKPTFTNLNLRIGHRYARHYGRRW